MARKRRAEMKRKGPEPSQLRREAAGSATDAAREGGNGDVRRKVAGLRPRTWIVAFAAVLVLGAGYLGLRRSGPPHPDDQRSSIILVSIDTLRADRLPVYGYGRIKTPTIDQLAANGTVFESCYAHVPLTLPSHTSIFTGLLPYAHGVRDNIGFRVADGAWTLASALRSAGFTTGAAVSAYVLHSTTGISQGFAWYDDQFEAGSPGKPATDVRRNGMVTVDRALSWLREELADSGSRSDHARGIFLFVHLYEPHAPYEPPERFLLGGTTPYDGAVMYSDEIVAHLFTELRKLDLYDPSLVILLSDHGEGLNDHGEETHGVFLYREVMRVPLIVKLPENSNGGWRIQAPVQLVDIAPTILEWAGLRQPPELQGQSLIPALRDHRLPADRGVYGESLYGRFHFGWSKLFSLTNSRFDFILAPREELYDIRQDPGEVRNLLAQGTSGAAEGAQLPEEIAREYASMHAELDDHLQRTSPAGPEPIDQEQARKLRALGYLGPQAPEPLSDTDAPDPKDRIGDLADFQMAMRLKDHLMFSKAAGVLQEVLETSPRMIDAWDQLGETYQRLGNLDEAVEALRRSLEIAPQMTPQRFELADLLTRLKRFDEARIELAAAASQEPDVAEVRIAYLEVAAGRPEAARESAARAAPGFPAALPFIEGVLAYGQGDYQRAVPPLQKALDDLHGRSDDVLPYVHFYLGDSLVRTSRHIASSVERAQILGTAERHLRRELTLSPTNPSAVMSLCVAHALAGDTTKIDGDLANFARENPSAATYQFIAGVYRSLNAPDRADQWESRAHQDQTSSGSVG